ncbi:MAG: Hsp70 family protein, partial [bacterium]
APRGMPKVEVTFDIDANGIVNVSAKDQATGKEQSIRIESSSGLSEDEIETMVKDSETHSEEDQNKRELAETKNRLDSLLYEVNKNLVESKDKISEEDVKNIETALEEGREALKSDDTEAMNKAIENITQASHKLAEILYQQTQEAAGGEGADAQAGSPGGESDEDVVDAEYTDE